MTAMRLHRYGASRFGKIGAGATMMRHILPAGARWVEYLESTGTQYIDTGVSPYGRTPKVIIDYAMKSTGGGIFGTWGANNTRFQIYRSPSPATTGSLGIGQYVNIQWRNDTRYLIDMDASTMTATVNGVRYTGFSAPNGFANYNLYLFWRNNNNNDGTLPIAMFCYSCKIWDGLNLVCDFHPIAIGTTGYMLDLISGEYMPYGNKGTGDFVIGPDAPPPTI